MKTPVFDPGSVRVALRCHDGAARNAEVRVVRPAAAAVLRGRKADEAVRLLPLLYGICGAAQGVAARLALTAARGQGTTAAVDARVLAEALGEHLWRLLLDWPQALGLPRQEALLVAGRRKLADGSFADWAGPALRQHLAIVENALLTLPRPTSCEDRLLPPLGAADTITVQPRLDAKFAAAPTHGGVPAATGALARHPQLASLGPMAGRVMARAADLLAPEGLGNTSAETITPGIGRAAVETARGLLLHEIVLDGDVVADYVIVAPTEWNFHPSGALTALLDRVPASSIEELRTIAARAVLAFDPCVPWEIDVRGPGSATTP